ncbi:Gp49 family protein [Dysosmobacter sp.]
MEHYIGTKLIEAEPCPAWKDAGAHRAGEDGYKVRYPDGYESWSPKDVFEGAYLPLTVNHKLKPDRPSISQEMVDDFIASVETVTMGDKTTVVRATLRNGFEIVEASACVSAENYDEELGRQICLEHVKDKVWMLLGFLLQTAVHGVSERSGRSDVHCQTSGLSFGLAIEAMKAGKKVARSGWNGKNQHIELASAISYKSPEGTVVNVEHDAIGNQAVAFCGTSGVQMGWLASQADMLAEDWKIVE